MGCGEEFASRRGTSVFMHKANAEKYFPGCFYAVRDADVYSLASLVFHHHDKASILDLYTFYCQCSMVAYRAPHARSSAASVALRAEMHRLEQAWPGRLGPPARGGGKKGGRKDKGRGGPRPSPAPGSPWTRFS